VFDSQFEPIFALIYIVIYKGKLISFLPSNQMLNDVLKLLSQMLVKIGDFKWFV